jgi:hypothetical protein
MQKVDAIASRPRSAVMVWSSNFPLTLHCLKQKPGQIETPVLDLLSEILRTCQTIGLAQLDSGWHFMTLSASDTGAKHCQRSTAVTTTGKVLHRYFIRQRKIS